MEDNSRRQSLKVIISELIMVIAVVATVCALAFIVSGYWVNSDFKIERNGMLQVSSVPSGADLDIDGESSWLRRTNTSKILSSGEHSVTISKEGYDTWSKTINISEGLLYRLNYPRLFPENRKPEIFYNAAGATYATTTPDHTKVLLIGNTTEWRFIDLRDEKVQPKLLNVTNLLSETKESTPTGLFSGEIVASKWNGNGERVLLLITEGDSGKWVIVDTRNTANSVNLSATHGEGLANIEFIDDYDFLALSNGNLIRFDTRDKVSTEEILAKDVDNYSLYGNEIIYSAKNADGKYRIGIMNTDGTHDETIEVRDGPSLVGLFNFYEESFIVLVENNAILVCESEGCAEPVLSSELSFEPSVIKIGKDGEFVLASSGPHIAAVDMEANVITSWQVAGESFGWIDNYMPYSVSDGELTVYDFDGLNKRSLAKNASSRFPVLITDNKWLYYFSDGNLIRERMTVE